jgi:regulatory protein
MSLGGRTGQALSLKGRALKALSQREHSRAELLKKLRPHAGPDDDLPALLDQLAEQGWISEARVAQSVVHRRASRLGVGRLKQELQAKGLAPELVAATVAELADTEGARARAVWQKKFGAPAADAKARAAQVRFLLGRGFAPGVVSRVLRADPDLDFDPDDGSSDI